MNKITNKKKAKEIAKDAADRGFDRVGAFCCAMEAMEWKDEIMEKTLESSVSAEVGYFNQHGLSIYFDKSLEKLGFEEGDKVKVLIIKEDKL